MSESGKFIYSCKSLINNWQEDRCTSDYDQSHFKTQTKLPNPNFTKYVTTSMGLGGGDKYEVSHFSTSTDNWLKFQPKFKEGETYKTIYQVEHKKPEEQAAKFKILETPVTSDPKKLDEYKERWTNGHQTYGRTYLGAIPYKKLHKGE